MIMKGTSHMFTRSDLPLRRRVALAVGAGGLVLLGGAGVAYAASSDAVETGWATVVDTDRQDDRAAQSDAEGSARADRATADRSAADRDCPDNGTAGGTAEGPGTGSSPDQGPSTTPEGEL